MVVDQFDQLGFLAPADLLVAAQDNPVYFRVLEHDGCHQVGQRFLVYELAQRKQLKQHFQAVVVPNQFLEQADELLEVLREELLG